MDRKQIESVMKNYRRIQARASMLVSYLAEMDGWNNYEFLGAEWKESSHLICVEIKLYETASPYGVATYEIQPEHLFDEGYLASLKEKCQTLKERI